MRGVSELARMTPAAVEEKYGVPPHRYPELAAIVGETSDNLPGVPGVGPGLRREVDQPVRRPRQRHRPRRRDHRQEGRGAARAPRRRDPQPPAQRAGARPRPRAPARPTWRSQPWDRHGRCSRCSTSLEFRRAAQPAVRDASTPEEEPSSEGGLRARRPHASAAGERRRRGSTSSAHRARSGVHVARQLGRRHRRGRRPRASPTADGQAA